MTRTLLESAKQISASALDAVNPERLVRDGLRLERGWLEIQGRRFDLSEFAAIDVLAFGKAAVGMARTAAEILEGKLRRGLLVTPPGPAPALPGFTRLEGSHPHPDARSEAAGRAALELARGSGPFDLLLLLVSGGGSALLAVPLPGLELQAKADLARELMARGADIRELNAVRKHLSAIKGGGLAAAAAGQVVNLLLSDVPGDDPEVIASGPGCPDASTFADAAAVLQRFGLWDEPPAGVRETIEAGLHGRIPETLKKGDPAAGRISTFIIGRNATALAAARREAEALGYRASILAAGDSGEARDAAARYVPAILAAARALRPGDRPIALIAGGEHTVTVHGRGLGGRNQEFVLAALVDLDRQARAGEKTNPAAFGAFARTGRLYGRDWLVMSFGTDGIDGPTPAAGAWGGPDVLARVKSVGMNMETRLEDNDSYRFFQKTGGLYMTGPTGTNVMDVRLFLTA
ncbi:MAG: DUF4147 domain-containing protein [Candidatus Aminicenantes bacterium]|nr:DUF4147 domain-containing protein [Candidatus Aminicenantes bacterium]